MKRQQWSVLELNHHVLWHTREFVVRRKGEEAEKNGTYIALSDYMMNDGRAPIHRASLKEIEDWFMILRKDE